MILTRRGALVTGGGSGFGAGIARAFRAEGAEVMLADVNAEAVEAMAGVLGAHWTVADVSENASVACMAAASGCCNAAAAARRAPGCGYTGGKITSCNSGFLPVKRRQPVRGHVTSTQGSTGAPHCAA